MQLTIPELSLVLLVGPSGCGKSTFARRHFRPTEVLSSDFFRGLVCDDQGNQAASRPAFDLLHQVLARRMEWRRFTVIDATNLQADGRKPLLELARRYHYLITAILFDLEEDVCQAHNRARPDRVVPPRVISGQMQHLRRSLHALEKEGVRHVHFLRTLQEVEAVTIRRVPLWTDRRQDRGPFDIIGDLHGCFHELVDLLERLGYLIVHQPNARGLPDLTAFPPPGRKAIFVGDLGDRGPETPSVYRLVMGMVQAGNALCVMGNHDNKLLRKLRGNTVKATHGLADTLAQLEPEPPEFLARMREFLEDLVSHYVLDEGRLVVAHAGLREDLQGRASGRVRAFALYGDTTGETDEDGMPVRLNWAAEYRGSALVIYGHTPVARLAWLNNTLNIDTGCVFGGTLTALRYPERELVSVPARRQYCDYGRPFLLGEAEAEQTPQHQVDDQLDLSDVTGKRLIETRLLGPVLVKAEQSAAALEVMSRFAANPKWLIYLPPTMSPCETSREAGYLEHPAEALGYYRNLGLEEVICQEKHMGSRAVVIVCRDEGVARRAFGVEDEGKGIVLTRTGRRFFDEPLEQTFLDVLGRALDDCRFWETHTTDWVCLDCELMPWSAKAQELLRNQYAAVGAAARSALAEVNSLLSATRTGQAEIAGLAQRYRKKAEAAEGFVAAYRRYCWPVESVRDLRLAPFHLLATRAGIHVDQPHPWHLDQLAPLIEASEGLVVPTRSLRILVRDPAAVQRGIAWWHERTEQGGEGMVVKPLDFVTRGPKGLIQPAIKCRGREYLRIIYGPDYLEAENLERLRQRGLSSKRGLALREFSLGIEALERFHRQEPLRRIHECSFAVLALESEPIDSRL